MLVVAGGRKRSLHEFAIIPVGDLPHGIWPSGDGTRVYVGIENGDAVTAIDTATNGVIATIPNGQAAQALVYIPQAVPAETAGVDGLQPLGIAGAASHLKLVAPGQPTFTTVGLFDQGLTQVLQAAVAGLEPDKPYALALTSNSDGTGQIEPIARFITNGAGAQVVNAVGPIRQIVHPSDPRQNRRYLAIMAVENGKLDRPVQLQQIEDSSSGGRALQ
jgi:YVTN family beta-propeller protein